jgi:hypothetical protein
VVTVAEAPVLERKKAAELADVIIAGEHNVDLAVTLDALGSAGIQQGARRRRPEPERAACGRWPPRRAMPDPLTAAGRGGAKRILAGPGLVTGPGWRLRSLCEQDGFLFLRYRPK